MSKIDPKEIEKRMARISEMFSEMVAHAETVSQTRCPYRDRHDLCTAEFRCRNQKPPAEEGARHPCGHDGNFKTLAVLWTQQRWRRVSGKISSSAFQKPRAPSPMASSGPIVRPAPAQACQQLTPALGALAHPRLEAHEFLASLRRGADEDQNALLLVLQPTLEIDAIGPHVDVASGRQVAPAPALVLGLPLRLQAADYLRRQARGVLAEQRLQRLLEVPAGHATKVERRQNRIQRPRPPRETGQNGRRETDALSSDAGTVPDLRAPHRHRTNASQDRPFRPVAMTHKAPAAVFGLRLSQCLGIATAGT